LCIPTKGDAPSKIHDHCYASPGIPSKTITS
jgi:hypothetical protein